MNTFDTFKSKFDFNKFMIRVSDHSYQVGNLTHYTVKVKHFIVISHNYIIVPAGYITSLPKTQAEAIEFLTNL